MFSGEVYIIYKAAGFCFIGVAMDRFLRMNGKNELANILHTIGWCLLGIYSIKFVLDHAKNLHIGW